jgi:two-component system LytT family response regulator
VVSPKTLRVLIVDDEALARQRLEDLLAKEIAVEVVGSIESAAEAVQVIRKLRPDLLFLDVQMPGKTGLDIVREVDPRAMPLTIFVTAFDRYAVEAFDLAAVDYLVKPFDDERFQQAFRRARRAIELEEVGRLSDRLLAVLQARDSGSARAEKAPPSSPAYLERIAVETRGQVRVIRIAEIDYITASGAYAELHVGKNVHLIRERMQTLERRLDPERFFRIHRSAIIRLDLIETLQRNPGGDYAVRLKSGVGLKVSRSRFEELEERLGFRGERLRF